MQSVFAKEQDSGIEGRNMAMTKEYGVFGLAMGMFDLTAAGIASAILFAFLVAIFFKPKS